MEIITIQSWNEFDAIGRELDGWAFRGQRNADWPLLSSLSRYLINYVPDESCWPERESRAIRIFRRKAHNYITDLRILDDDLRCLALMQHHGAPTRLLDFTKSPYVALFFALEYATSDAAVYALNTPVLWDSEPEGQPQLRQDRIDPRGRGNYRRYFVSNKHEMIWAGEPQAMDQRLLAQSGTFVVPGVLNKPVDAVLQRYASSEPLIKKIVIPTKRLRAEFMQSLYRMNITNATIYPDLNGLAKSIAFELEIIWKGLDPSHAPQSASKPRKRRPVK